MQFDLREIATEDCGGASVQDLYVAIAFPFPVLALDHGCRNSSDKCANGLEGGPQGAIRAPPAHSMRWRAPAAPRFSRVQLACSPLSICAISYENNSD